MVGVEIGVWWLMCVVVANVGCDVQIGVCLWRRSVCGVEILWYFSS